MSKTLTRLALTLLAASLCAAPIVARTRPAQSSTSAAATPEWVVVSPPGEGFGVLMSKQPARLEQRVKTEGLSVSGRRYAASAADGQTTFTVWALKDTQDVGRRLLAADNSAEGVGGQSLYLDRIAELAWELLMTPEIERLKREGDTGMRAARAEMGMSYERQFELSDRPAREYVIRLENERGLVYVCADGARIYIVAGLGAAALDPRLKLFADSFTIGGKPNLPEVRAPILPAAPQVSNPSLPVPSTIQADPLLADPALVKTDPRDIPYGLPKTVEPSAGLGRGGGMGTGSGVGPGRGGGNVGGGDRIGGGGSGGEVDYTRPFRQSEVTKRALITFKPEPGFTEWARRFNVTGVVRVRAILHSSGTVQSISVVKSLPHGLTRKALDALKVIRFQPAQKDGRAVSQYAVFEYNFNIY